MIISLEGVGEVSSQVSLPQAVSFLFSYILVFSPLESDFGISFIVKITHIDLFWRPYIDSFGLWAAFCAISFPYLSDWDICKFFGLRVARTSHCVLVNFVALSSGSSSSESERPHLRICVTLPRARVALIMPRSSVALFECHQQQSSGAS